MSVGRPGFPAVPGEAAGDESGRNAEYPRGFPVTALNKKIHQ